MHRIVCTSLIGLIFTALASAVRAAEPLVVRLWPGDPVTTQPYDATDTIAYFKNSQTLFGLSGVKMPSIAVYLPKGAEGPVPAILICPGGGYAMESAIGEGTHIAEKLNAYGIAGIVLKYRLPDGKPPAAGELPMPQQDVLRAMQIVRSRAAEWKLNPKKIGVMGFSAGGHLAATAATMFDQAKTLFKKAGDDATAGASARPDFAVLVYPVITMGEHTHAGSLHNLLGAAPTPELVGRFSADRHVTSETPPLLIVHAEDDGLVPVANALQMADAAARAKVPCDLLLFKSGGHGFGLGPPGSEAAGWFDAMLDWMKRGGLTAGAR